MSGEEIRADPVAPSPVEALRAARRRSDARAVSILDATDRALLLRLVPELVRIRISLLRRDYSGTRKALETRLAAPLEPAALDEDALWRAHRAGRIANGLARRVPFDARCLVRSLAVWTVLRDARMPVDLRIGVSRQDGFEAHAWVDLMGEPITDTHDKIAKFQVFEKSWY